MRRMLPTTDSAASAASASSSSFLQSASSTLRSLSRFDSTFGVSVETADESANGGAANDDSSSSSSPAADTGEVLRDALTLQLHFKYGAEFEHSVAALCILVGLLLCFFGKRLFRPLLFLLTWICLGGILYLVTMLAFKHSLAAFLTGAIGGLLTGLLVLKIWKLALTLTGMLTGLVVWTALQEALPHAFTDPGVKFGSLAVLMIACVFLALYLEKTALLLATPLLGAFLAVQGFSHFVARGQYSALDILHGTAAQRANYKCSTACALLTSSMFGLALMGLYVQWRWTSKAKAAKKEKSKEKSNKAAEKEAAKEEKAAAAKKKAEEKERDLEMASSTAAATKPVELTKKEQAAAAALAKKQAAAAAAPPPRESYKIASQTRTDNPFEDDENGPEISRYGAYSQAYSVQAHEDLGNPFADVPLTSAYAH